MGIQDADRFRKC